MGEGFITRRGGVTSEETAAPTITIVSETGTGVTFTLTNNDDNTALITYEIDGNRDVVSLAAAATSSNITVALDAGTYTLSAFATVVGEVASSDSVSVEIELPQYEELFSTTLTAATTTINITGLNIGKDDGLRLVYTHVGSTSVVRIYANNNTTNSNYFNQGIFGDGASLSAARGNDPTVFNGSSTGFADIKISNNDRFVCQTQYNDGTGSSASAARNLNRNITSTFSVTSLTQLTLTASSGSGLGVGTKIALYKVTEAG